MGIEVFTPPVGHVYNVLTRKMENRGVYSRSAKKEDQYWETIEIPNNYWDKRQEEERKQEKDPTYYDPGCEAVRRDMWDRRLNGMWFNNNGKPTYVTGAHFFYLNFNEIDIGLPGYREPDRKYYYFWRYIEQDPEALGMFEGTGRRGGKSYRAGSILIERTTRMRRYNGGIQSKTDADAKTFFRSKVIQVFKRLPHFFKPVFDTSKGDTPEKEIRFFHPTQRGSKAAKMADKKDHLESTIDYRSSGIFDYDGYKMHTYVCDEVGKTELDVNQRHRVVRPCLVQGSTQRIIGKAIYTTTVEDIKNIRDSRALWRDSNQNERTKNGRTKSGLYKFFTPADELDNFDLYGFPDKAYNRKYILDERESYADDVKALNDIIRKNPLSEEEMFRIASDTATFNVHKLNLELDRVLLNDNRYERGNFIFTNGFGSDVIWQENPLGKWLLAITLEQNETNLVIRNGEKITPRNNHRFACGIDPYDHKYVSDQGKKSKGAIAVMRKSDVMNGLRRRFVCLYVHRPNSPDEFYEDAAMTCIYFGIRFLHENNKPTIADFMEKKNMADFLTWLPGRNTPGLPANTSTHGELSDMLENFIEFDLENGCPFEQLLEDWIEFDLTDTQRFDATMASGYCVIQDQKVQVAQVQNNVEISEVFRKHKIKVPR